MKNPFLNFLFRSFLSIITCIVISFIFSIFILLFFCFDSGTGTYCSVAQKAGFLFQTGFSIVLILSIFSIFSWRKDKLKSRKLDSLEAMLFILILLLGLAFNRYKTQHDYYISQTSGTDTEYINNYRKVAQEPTFYNSFFDLFRPLMK